MDGLFNFQELNDHNICYNIVITSLIYDFRVKMPGNES